MKNVKVRADRIEKDCLFWKARIKRERLSEFFAKNCKMESSNEENFCVGSYVSDAHRLICAVKNRKGVIFSC
ncbi:hypothetical protein J4462_00020 [Candidatus Pacearchaeota archaeon]|nr:hypothetical protein [Candidatus Pacearchaeota archaeon]